jgi:hypothetical protein
VPGGHRLLGPHVGRRAEASRGHELDERVEVDDAGAAHEQQHAARADELQLRAAQEPLVVGGDRGEDEDHALPEDLVERRRLGIVAPDQVVGQPRVVHPDRRVERRDEAAQLTPEVAEADDADRAAGHQERVLVALQAVGLGAGAHGAVSVRDPARKVDRHAEGRLGHRQSEGRARVEHVDAAVERRGVVDVREEVALDVDDRAQMGRAVEPLPRHRGLTDDRSRLRQVTLDQLVRHRPVLVHHQRPERLEPRSRGRVADHRERAGERVDEDHPARLTKVRLPAGSATSRLRSAPGPT